MARRIDLEVIEADLLVDRSAIPGAVDAWLNMPARSRARWLKIFGRGETVRPAFEAGLADEPGAEQLWATFCPTEQREILGLVKYRRFWSRRWEIRRLLQVRASGTVQAQLAPGDIIRGERAKFWPSPFWWHVKFELADDSFDGLRYDAVGVARILRQLAALPEWDVTTAHRSFIATRIAV